MKKQYVAPEVEIVIFEMQDIITHSLATGGGANESSWPWGDITADGRSLTWNGITIGD